MVIKPILPSLREKKRYIVYEMISDKKFKFKEAKETMDRVILKFLGELGYSKAGIIHLDNFKNNKGIIRVNHKEVDNVKTSLMLIEKINNHKVLVKTNLVTGLLNKAKNMVER
tara:strand:- start:22569 stop:22907 length:339 start_codon:yes stop_codon:yes gene_type:complete